MDTRQGKPNPELPPGHAVCSGNPPPIHSLQLQIHHPLRPIHRFELPIRPSLLAISVSYTANTRPPTQLSDGGVGVSKENRENLEDCGVNADFTCMPVVPKPGAISGLSHVPSSHQKNPTTTPSLEFSPGAHIVSKRLGLKPPCSTAAAHFPAVMWLCCAGGAGPPHTRVTTGGLAGGRPARGAVIVRVDSCQSRPSTSVYQPLPAR